MFQIDKLLEKTPHALLFEGPKGSGKGECARDFARKLLQTNKKDPPDLRELYPEGKAHLHPMYAIRLFINETALPPFEAKRKVCIIHEADRMLPSSSNALLKTLEEPLDHTTIILISSRPSALLPTVTSRCFRVSFSSSGKQETDSLPEEMFHVALRLLRGDLPLAKELPEGADPEEALSYIFYSYRDLHLLKSGADPSLLFYQDKAAILSRISVPLPSLETLQKRLEEALLATTLNLPLAHTLPALISID